MIRSIWKRGRIQLGRSLILPRGEFGRNVLILLTGTTFAQAISILISPLLTRLYSPEAFGIYAMFLAVSTFLTFFSAGTYENAIILPEQDEDGFSLLALSCVLVVGVSIATFGLIMAFNLQIVTLLSSPELSSWLYVVPVMVLLSGWYNALNYWNNRRKNFKRLSRNRVARSVLAAGANTTLGVMHWEAGGLIIGQIFGQLAATGLYGFQIRQEDRFLARTVSTVGIKQQAVRYKNFPKFLIPSGLVEQASGQLPLILLSSLFGAATLGFFSLALRMVNLPMGLMADAIRDVFRQSASEEYALSGNCRAIFVRTFRRLIALSVLPFIGLVLLGPTIFAIVFGAQWRVAGEYAQIMSAMFFFRFVSSPLSSMFIIAEKQKWDLLIQAVTFVTIVLALRAVVSTTDSPKTAVVVYSVVYSLKYIVELYLSYRYSSTPPRSVTA